jgi:Asp-tRNA(Asn)/Glu-tRNA(Gln) amidotransferase A subunit family amidase
MPNDTRFTRRQVLAGVSALIAGSSSESRESDRALRSNSGDANLISLSAVDAARAIARGDLTAEHYASTLLARCRSGASLNAFACLRPERVLESARECDLRRARGELLGSLHGIPIPIKDSINTRDMPTTAGAPALRNFRPAADAPLVRRLREAGAIVMGKTNLHELSCGYTCTNPLFGQTHNPYDPARIPGGSSGGSAAAVAYRMAPLGVGEDTEGSIRIPASLCGIVGFRPTTGRYPTAGTVPLDPLFDQLGPLARSVADLLLFDTVMTGDSSATPLPLKGARLGIVRSYWYGNLDSETERITNTALAVLVEAGAELVEGELPDLVSLLAVTSDPIQYHDAKPALSDYLAHYHTGVTFDALLGASSSQVRDMLSAGLPGGPYFISEKTYRDAVDVQMPLLRAMFREYYSRGGISAIVFPATALPAPPLGDESMTVVVRGRTVAMEDAMSHNIIPGNAAGLPGLVLPAGLTSNGLPVALEFDGPAASDRALLRLGLSLETVLGRLPPPPT